MKRYIWLLLIFLISCGPKEFVPYEPPKIDFNATKPYTLDLSSIQKPDKLQPIFVDKDFNEVDMNNASYIVLTPKEYGKINTLLKIATTYKKVALEQAELVNIHIDTINSLKEFLELERNKSLQYRELWINAENNYRYEKYEHTKDNFINKTGMYLISIGGVILLAIGL